MAGGLNPRRLRVKRQERPLQAPLPIAETRRPDPVRKQEIWSSYRPAKNKVTLSFPPPIVQAKSTPLLLPRPAGRQCKLLKIRLVIVVQRSRVGCNERVPAALGFAAGYVLLLLLGDFAHLHEDTFDSQFHAIRSPQPDGYFRGCLRAGVVDCFSAFLAWLGTDAGCGDFALHHSRSGFLTGGIRRVDLGYRIRCGAIPTARYHYGCALSGRSFTLLFY